jgi:hypothetical protein
VVPEPHVVYAENAQWFAALLGSPTEKEFSQIARLFFPLDRIKFGTLTYPDRAARAVIAQFGISPSSRIHLFVPGWLAEAILARDHQWNKPGLLWRTDELIPQV